MAKNAKKNARHAVLLRLRAEFLGVKNTKHMSVKLVSQHIHAKVGTQKFLTYIVSSGRLSEWEAHKKRAEAGNSRVRNISKRDHTDKDMSRKTYDEEASLYNVESSESGSNRSAHA